MTSASAFFNCSSLLSTSRVQVAPPEGRNLSLLELGLGDDVAIHLDEHLLDDLNGAPARSDRDEPARGKFARWPPATVLSRAGKSFVELCMQLIRSFLTI